MVHVPTAAPPAHEQRVRLSYPEWLAWAGGGQQSEWVDGLHARILAFLSGVLGWYVEAFGVGEVLQAPVELRLRPGRLSREPDLIFVAERHRDWIGARRVEGAADLVVEVVSEQSESRDRVEKLGEYQAAAIPEYWIFDPRPDQRRSDFFQLLDGVYQPVGLDADARYHSAVVPGFWLRPDWLWQEPLPTRRACLLEIAPETLLVPSSGKATP